MGGGEAVADRSSFCFQRIDFVRGGIANSEPLFREPVIGIWIHEDRSGDRFGIRAAYKHQKPRCGYANVYRGRKANPSQIDTMCGRCGKRVRFAPVRLYWKKGIGERGSVRQARLIYQNHAGGIPALEAIAKELNAVDETEHTEGFTRASKLLEDKSSSQMGVNQNETIMG